MVKKSKNIFEARNPFSNLSTEKTKSFVKQFEQNENIRAEILKISGAKITTINEKLIEKSQLAFYKSMIIEKREKLDIIKVNLNNIFFEI